MHLERTRPFRAFLFCPGHVPRPPQSLPHALPFGEHAERIGTEAHRTFPKTGSRFAHD